MLPDEVFFRLVNLDDAFSHPLRKYTSAVELASTSSGQAKTTYEKKGETNLQELVKWL